MAKNKTQTTISKILEAAPVFQGKNDDKTILSHVRNIFPALKDTNSLSVNPQEKGKDYQVEIEEAIKEMIALLSREKLTAAGYYSLYTLIHHFSRYLAAKHKEKAAKELRAIERAKVPTGGAKVTRLTPGPDTPVATGGCADCPDGMPVEADYPASRIRRVKVSK